VFALASLFEDVKIDENPLGVSDRAGFLFYASGLTISQLMYALFSLRI
jgi:hypothetical protein